MALIEASNLALNDMERGAGAVVKTIASELASGKTLKDGDIVYVGGTGEDCLITDITILIKEFFPAGATVDFGYYSYPERQFNAIQTGIAVGEGDTTAGARTIPLDIPTDGNVNPDGTGPYTGTAGAKIYGGTSFAFIYHGADTPAQGEVIAIVGYQYFGNKQTGGYVPRGL